MQRLWCLLFAAACGFAADVNTFSIVGYDAVKRRLGRRGGVAIFLSRRGRALGGGGGRRDRYQANVNVGYGPRGLELLRQGHLRKGRSRETAGRGPVPANRRPAGRHHRRKGNIATYTGPNAPKWAGDRQGKTWTAQGNILVGPQVPEAMGKAFEATDGELAEKLFAALQAGDNAGGDSRGKQSASMLVVRKGGGRNINNDRYIYINVDDNPQPIPELRRLLDLNLGLLYSEKVGRLRSAGKSREARDAAARVTHYMPTANSFFTLGVMDYGLADKEAALSDFRKAIELDGSIRQRFQATDAPAGGRGQMLRPILEDKEFVARLMQ